MKTLLRGQASWIHALRVGRTNHGNEKLHHSIRNMKH